MFFLSPDQKFKTTDKSQNMLKILIHMVTSWWLKRWTFVPLNVIGSSGLLSKASLLLRLDVITQLF